MNDLRSSENEEMLFMLEEMQDQIESLQTANAEAQQTISQISSENSMLRNELQKKSETIVSLNGQIEKLSESDLVLKQNEQLRQLNIRLLLSEKQAKEKAKAEITAAKQEADKLTEAKAQNIQKEANQSIKVIEKRYQEALNRYRGRFYLTVFYATLTTLLRAFCSEILIRDAVGFFEGFAGMLGSATSGFLSFADAVAGLGDELSQPAVGSIVHRLLWLLVLVALAGGCLALIGYAVWKYICFFEEKQADELSAFVGLAILAVVVFTGDMLAEILPINMILLGIICFIGYSLIRAVLETEDKELRNRMLAYTGIALGSIGCVALVLRIAGPMVLFVVPAALLFAAAGN